MTFTLTPYQSTAVDSAVAEIRDAQDAFNRRGKKKAIGLSAPTGAGKTVIATAVLERLLLGDADAPANRDLAVLWVTDDPALNRQTSDKMLLASARLTPSDLVFLDESFDEKTLTRGRIHFVHIQQLGVKSTVAWPGRDQREYGLWETFANTATEYGSDFLLVIDEAHRGTEGKKDATIVERLSHGGTYPDRNGATMPGTHPAAPVIFGITATPERFRKAMDRTGRSLEDVVVPVEDVRESGLLKDKIVVRHPGENQPSHETLLGLAVEALRKADAAWAEHYDTVAATGEVAQRVEPLLVIQVAPGTAPKDLAPYVAALESEWDVLAGDAVVHAFQEHSTLTVNLPSGEREVRYVAPDRIAADTRARVVFFKNALTTGWDCPRAEVMLSLRSAKDYTNIAQLIGRMVRTPLAERVETPGVDTDLLNSVALYLPHYDRSQVAKVVQALSEETEDDIEITVEPIDCVKRDLEEVPEEVWNLLGALPSTARVKKPYASETVRLLDLARLLRGHELLADASSQARARLVGAVRTEAAVRATDLSKAVEDVTTLDMAETVWDNRAGAFVSTESGEPVTTAVAAKTGDVDAQFNAAVRALPDAVAKWYWNDLCDADPDLDPYEAKAQVAALVNTPDLAAAFKTAVESAASSQIAAWRTQYANQVTMLPKQARLDFEAVWNPRSGSLTVDLEVPETVSAPTERIVGTGENATTEMVPVYDHHLYVAPDGNGKVTPGKFPAVLTGWEIDVLAKESSYPSLVGWYRNPPRSKHGLAVAYDGGDKVGLLYPDFMFFHTVDGETVVDIVDPHGHQSADTGPKWAGLARWAHDHSDKVRRVVAVIKVGENLLALDLTADDIADRLDACSTKSDIEALFDEHGGLY
ncbi:DEAD/DEAH box helicase [Nocardioides pakistanensis]